MLNGSARWIRKASHQSTSPGRNEWNDSKLVKEIVRDVYEKLFSMGRIGIYSKLLEIENMVCKLPVGIRRIGIWGMPGIGKTTLAKAVFDQMSGEFDASCFLENYEKVIHENGLYRFLEEQLLKEKPGLLRDKLNNKRVLVVLDDVRSPLLTESLLGGFDWFGPGSLIILTSRDKQVFRLCGVNQMYEVQGFNEKNALQLFFLCASIKDTTEQNLLELSVKVVQYASGNPLALNIFGKALKGHKKLSAMETAFVKLNRSPPLKIVDTFKSSYYTLTDSEKNIFLDIAAFFQGENVDYVMQLLDGCDFFPHVGIDVLVEKCLVTVSENRLQMHNLIQDVGREIINRDTVQIERRSRLWQPWSIKYLLEDNEHRADGERKTTSKPAQGTDEIEGIFLDASNISFNIKPAAFENMLNLRLLKIYCSNPEVHPVINFSKGVLNSLPNKLRLLHWENYSLQSLPQNFDPRHLVEINMPYSKLKKLWGGTKNLKMLRKIRLCHSQHLVDIEDLLKAQNIEVIDLQGCTRLQSFPVTDQLLHLRVVNLSGCTEIKNFPEIPPNIQTLHLQGTGIIDLSLSVVKPNFRELKNILTEIPGLSGVSNLEQIDLEPLTSRMKISTSNQDPWKLICLELKDCSRLQSLPNMVNFEFLNILDLSGCSGLETIQGFPRNLKELYLAGTAVREVPKLPQTLEVLNAHGCVTLKSIHLDFQQLPMHYTFSNCFDLSPQVVKDFLVKAVANVKQIPRDLLQELNKTLAFSFCAPSHANENSTLDLQPGSSVMMQLDPSWRSKLVGFSMLVEVSFSEDYYDATGFGIGCICRWKNEEGHFNRLERTFHFWGPGEAIPKVQNDHIFVFSDVKVFPSTSDILANLVVFEFFPVNKEGKRLDDSCTVTRCGLYVIASATDNTELRMSSSNSSLDPTEFSGNDIEEVMRVAYNDLQETDKALFLYIACLFNDKDVDLVVPLISTVDLDISSGLSVLANMSLIHVSSNGPIVMHSFLRKMGKEILRKESMLPGSWKDFTQDFEKVLVASSSSRKWKYDVFPSFIGEDVRRTFLSHLLQAFESKRINMFRDNEIDISQLIDPVTVRAIRESRILIVVLSENYASSSWNLNNLVEITKSCKVFGQRVIPIFYNVNPSHVRNQIGEFGNRFQETCKNKTENEKQEWCQALYEVANKMGYPTIDWDNEAKMVETIVDEVLSELNTTTTVSKDFDNFVGIKDHISKINTLLCLESNEVRMVGIWGPSGIGKSTIARALYSRLACHFQRSIYVDRDFIYKTMEYSRRSQLDDYGTKLYLQKQFLSEVLGQKYRVIYHLGMVSEKLKDQKVLIILDDAYDHVLLEALVGDTGWFGSGSRIIVITQDKRLLHGYGIDNMYKVDLPSKKQALC
ncbi:PREDICTED: probable WRKY transcription factor 16 [Camelina sativa]|uniref:Probable WRKY transcription factor 16 n=1 Tax=Camelina sativa TaxID=90675 RepID=A0ABM0Y2V3_CAMSA|nr:PREDICTED: probable WRKY transcription factor 16 [Camelina sativa]